MAAFWARLMAPEAPEIKGVFQASMIATTLTEPLVQSQLSSSTAATTSLVSATTFVTRRGNEGLGQSDVFPVQVKTVSIATTGKGINEGGVGGGGGGGSGGSSTAGGTSRWLRPSQVVKSKKVEKLKG
jgi:hypothetical protein